MKRLKVSFLPVLVKQAFFRLRGLQMPPGALIFTESNFLCEVTASKHQKQVPAASQTKSNMICYDNGPLIWTKRVMYSTQMMKEEAISAGESPPPPPPTHEIVFFMTPEMLGKKCLLTFLESTVILHSLSVPHTCDMDLY